MKGLIIKSPWIESILDGKRLGKFEGQILELEGRLHL